MLLASFTSPLVSDFSTHPSPSSAASHQVGEGPREFPRSAVCWRGPGSLKALRPLTLIDLSLPGAVVVSFGFSVVLEALLNKSIFAPRVPGFSAPAANGSACRFQFIPCVAVGLTDPMIPRFFPRFSFTLPEIFIRRGHEHTLKWIYLKGKPFMRAGTIDT